MPRRCNDCGLSKAQADFTATQWSKSEKARRCKLCVESPLYTRSAPSQAPATTAPTVTTTMETAPLSAKKLAPSNRERQREQGTPVVIHTRVRDTPDIQETGGALVSHGVKLPLIQSDTPTAQELELRSQVAQLESRLAQSIEVQKAQHSQIVELAASLQGVSNEHKQCHAEKQELETKLEEQARVSLAELKATSTNEMRVSAVEIQAEGPLDANALRTDAQTLNHSYDVVRMELERLVKEDSIARLMPEEEKGPWHALGPAQKLRHYIHRLEQLLEERRLDHIILSAQCNTLAQTASAQPINDSSFARLQATKVQRVKAALGCWTENMRDIIGEPPSMPGFPEPPVLTRLTFDLNKNAAFDAYEGPGEDDSKWDLDTQVVSALLSRDAELARKLLTGVQEVCLSEAGLNDMDIDTLAHALKGNDTITHLYLDENEFGNLGCESLASTIEGNRSLRVLSVVKNHIRDAGATALLRVLQGCSAYAVGCSLCGKPESQHPFCHICGHMHQGPSEGRVTFQYKNLGGVAIRKAPAYPGTRLDVDVAFKEILCATRIVIVPHNYAGKDYNIKFFELADGRGWVHDFHPEWLAVPTIQIIPDQVCSNFQLRDSCVSCGRAPDKHPWEGVPVQRLVIAENEISSEVQSRLRACTKNNRTRAVLHSEVVESIAVEVTVPPYHGPAKGILKRV